MDYLIFGRSADKYLDRFSSSAEVDAAWSGAESGEREALVVTQYAFLRAEMTDGHRPTSHELVGLLGDMVSCRPSVTVARWTVGGAATAVLGWIAVDAFSIDRGVGLVAAAGFLGTVGAFALNASWVLGPRGRAMRLLADAVCSPAPRRNRLLADAVALDPGKPGERFRLGR